MFVCVDHETNTLIKNINLFCLPNGYEKYHKIFNKSMMGLIFIKTTMICKYKTLEFNNNNNNNNVDTNKKTKTDIYSANCISIILLKIYVFASTKLNGFPCTFLIGYPWIHSMF